MYVCFISVGQKQTEYQSTQSLYRFNSLHSTSYCRFFSNFVGGT